jgi:hypothetical protein
MSKKYPLPHFLAEQKITQQVYSRWLARKSMAHVKRDKKRGNISAINEVYKTAIHKAVVDSGGLDEYTGEQLHWNLISKYNNEDSKTSRRKYKASFGLLPTVDHIGDGLGEADFKIYGWRTNDAKGDLSHNEFLQLCRRVVLQSERTQTKQQA